MVDLEVIKKHWEEAIHKAERELDLLPINQRLNGLALQQLSTAYATEHKCKGSLVYKTTILGERRYRILCATCGSLSQSVSAKKFSRTIVDAAIELDGLESQIYDYRRKLISDIENKWKTEQKAEWDSWYSEYLKSSAWQEKRKKVIQRAGGICEGCLEHKAVSVHHLTYAGVGDELLIDLVALCDECHKKAEDRKNNGRI